MTRLIWYEEIIVICFEFGIYREQRMQRKFNKLKPQIEFFRDFGIRIIGAAYKKRVFIT